MYLNYLIIKKIKKLFLSFIFSLSLIDYSYASSEIVIIKNCYDGDTCTTIEGEKIRLACIDTPEIKGSESETKKAYFAREYLNKIVANKELIIKRITYDRYGRTVAELYSGDLNIQKHLVDMRIAKIYKKYAHQCAWSDF